MSKMTAQFRATSCRLIRDLSLHLGRDMHDPQWVGGFCLPLIGNIGHECGGFALMEEGSPTVKGSLGGIGFPQWTGVKPASGGRPAGRRAQYMAFCRSAGLHPYSYEANSGFIIRELSTSAKGVVAATLAAGPADADANGFSEVSAQAVDRKLLGRVIKFEKLYENAGVKHYPSRYQYAILAKQAFEEWAAAGFQEPPAYRMPKARFTVAFDAEFGRGESDATTRFDSVTHLAPAAMPPERAAFLELVAQKVQDGTIKLPTERVRKGKWPEQLLSPDEIKAIQRRLRELGYVKVGEVDGLWDTSVVGAISMLQQEAGIEVDGHYGPATRKALIDGKKHAVSASRAAATSTDLLKAGEPTLQAAHPVSITAKIGAATSAAVTVVTGVTSYWPQASQTIDLVKSYFGDVPGWVYFAAITAVAAYLWLKMRDVKAAVTDAYQQGALTTIAKPLDVEKRDPGSFMPAVPDDEPAPTAVYRHIGPDDVAETEEDRPLGEDA